jgi:hypothetical protein
VVFLLTMSPVTAWAQSEISWSGTEPLNGVVVDGELFLDVAGAGSYPLVVIDDPGVAPPSFSVDTTVRHEEVEGVAYLEMWTVLEDGSRYFTRTLADSGPMAYMTGSSDDRPISLPFELGEGGPIPASLEINLVTEGSGRFWIADLTVVPADNASGETNSTATPATTAAANTNDPQVTTSLATATPTDVTGTGGSGTFWFWSVAALVVAGAVGFWWQTVRRRRQEEQRRMNAIDSLNS